MIRPARDGVEVYLCVEPVDFRKQIHGLATLVQERLQMNPFSSQLFVFFCSLDMFENSGISAGQHIVRMFCVAKNSLGELGTRFEGEKVGTLSFGFAYRSNKECLPHDTSASLGTGRYCRSRDSLVQSSQWG